jgi:hypothetical protein
MANFRTETMKKFFVTILLALFMSCSAFAETLHITTVLPRTSSSEVYVGTLGSVEYTFHPVYCGWGCVHLVLGQEYEAKMGKDYLEIQVQGKKRVLIQDYTVDKAELVKK